MWGTKAIGLENITEHNQAVEENSLHIFADKPLEPFRWRVFNLGDVVFENLCSEEKQLALGLL